MKQIFTILLFTYSWLIPAFSTVYSSAGPQPGGRDTSIVVADKPDAVNLKIFPNPATDYIRIEWQTTGRPEIHAEIYDLFGRRLISQKSRRQDNYMQIDIQSLQRSAYLLKVFSGDENFSRTFRIVKY